jgi:hypothetical protein
MADEHTHGGSDDKNRDHEHRQHEHEPEPPGRIINPRPSHGVVCAA